MFNIEELEKKWLRYKIKSYIPHATISIITILIFILFLLYNSTNIKKTAILNKNIKTTKEIEPKIIKEEIKNILKNPVQITLTPSLEFINSVKKSTKDTNKPKHITRKKTIIKKELKKETINIIRKNSSDDIKNIIKRFKKSNSPALSLFLAKKYYDLGNYNEAYNYALTTNKLNNNIEASWILFSKSLVKLNKKDKALKVLRQYINYSNSNKAKVLLNNILAGKFK